MCVCRREELPFIEIPFDILCGRIFSRSRALVVGQCTETLSASCCKMLGGAYRERPAAEAKCKIFCVNYMNK